MSDDFDPWADPPAAAELTPSAVPPSPASTGELFQAPRLGIIHLIAWTAVAAVLFKLDVAMQRVEAESEFTAQVNYRVLVTTYQMGFAAQLVAFAAIMRAGALRHFRSLQPGHWLVLILTTFGIVGQALWRSSPMLTATMDMESRYAMYRVFGWIRLGSMLIECVALFVAAHHLRAQKPWHWIVRIEAILLLVSVFTTMSIASVAGLALAGVWPLLQLVVCVLGALADSAAANATGCIGSGLLTACLGAVVSLAWLILLYTRMSHLGM